MIVNAFFKAREPSCQLYDDTVALVQPQIISTSQRAIPTSADYPTNDPCHLSH